MAPKDLEEIVSKYVSSNNVMIFSKSTCPFCTKVKDLFSNLSVPFFALELDNLENGPEIQDILELQTGQRTVPNVFVSGIHIGGCDKTMEAHKSGRFQELISPAKMDFDYDLIVIGGGSGGLAAAKVRTLTAMTMQLLNTIDFQEAATLGAKVAVFDFVKPSPVGSCWGLGGTCVNVGCIPKKLMHYAGVLGKAIKDSQSYGWKFPQPEEKNEQQPAWIHPVIKVDHEWDKLREGVQNYIASLNWNYRVSLREKKVDYINAFAHFVSANTILAIDKKEKEHTYTAERFLLATGLRPRYPDIPGAKEFGITSDDLFSLKYSPGKTLCVGASYVSLECAGFLKQVGFDVDVMVRSILLRGFDQQMASMVGNNLEQLGVRFYKEYVPTSVEQMEAGQPGKLKVTFKKIGGEDTPMDEIDSEEYNTVLFAIGRDPCTADLKLENVGVRLNPKNGKVPVVNEQTNVPYVYALGDIADEKLELTPVAIQAGVLLARRLYGGSNLQCDYSNVPTTVFTPVEYSCVGYAEELAIEKFGEDNVEVYHLNFAPLDYALPGEASDCYVKMICLKSEKVKILQFWRCRKKVKEKVIGLHILCPNSGEIMQGFALAVKLGATKADFDNLIGIHPTSAEILTTLSVTKRSGGDTTAGGC